MKNEQTKKAAGFATAFAAGFLIRGSIFRGDELVDALPGLMMFLAAIMLFIDKKK